MAKVAMLVGNDFEDIEVKSPREALERAGHEVEFIGAKAGETIRGKRGDYDVTTSKAASKADPADYDGLVLPGGYGPDALRIDEGSVSFTKKFAQTQKTLAAICHGPQLLIEAEAVRGRRMTSWPSVKTDLRNAGAHWVDEPCVTDGSLITSRKPDDLDAFNDTLLSRLATHDTTH